MERLQVNPEFPQNQFHISSNEIGYVSAEKENQVLHSINSEIPALLQKYPKHQENIIKQIDISIGLSVSDIFKIITRNTMLNYKHTLINIHVYLTLTLAVVFLMLMLSYLRPIYFVNKFICFDPNTRSFSKCFYRNYCQCLDKDQCIDFCYKNTYLECKNYFVEEINKSDRLAYLSQIVANKRYVMYDLKHRENKTVFQYIGKHYCSMANDILFLVTCFILGGVIGFVIFGIVGDIKGKKKTISIVSIGLLIALIPFCVLSNYELQENHTLFLTLWCLAYFISGMFLFPFESLLYMYILEISPKPDGLKTFNGLLFMRYIISFGLYQIYNVLFRNYTYYYYFFAAYMLVFSILFICFYTETARFYSERNDLMNKAQAIRYFIKESDAKTKVNFDKKTNQKTVLLESIIRIALIKKNEESVSGALAEKNKKKIKKAQVNPPINYSFTDIVKIFYNDDYVFKKFRLMLLCHFTFNLCFYTIILSMVCDFEDPNKKIDITEVAGVTPYMFLIFLFLQGLSYFLFEIIDLDTIIIASLALFSVISLTYDFNQLLLDYAKVIYFGSDIDRELVKNYPWRIASSFWIMTYIISIYELMVMLQVPTVYRTIFYSGVKAVSCFSYYLSILTVFLFESSVLLIGILSFILAVLLAVMTIKWKLDMFEEWIDIKNKQNSKGK